MNREIKFRGQRVDNGEMVHGDLIHGVNHKKGKTYILPVRGGVMALGHGLDPMDGYEVIPETVGQLTGLKDKNGTEIYEWDIIKRNSNLLRNSPVVFVSGSFIVKEGEDENGIFGIRIRTDFEVIGNIYQNAELLTKTQIQ
jgi:uncharacterized phage protein (TIGR01671 family)